MRITNKVMQNNSLRNINRNKELQDKLNTELATGKKVNKPSDDPVVAIRALRLRSDVNQISQYSKKNVPDAESWLDLTESSITTTISVVKGMIEQCEKGANDPLKTEDRKIIIDALKELRNEVYATGNADYAGRYIFSGYRTDSPVTMVENNTDKYSINEAFTGDDITDEIYISTRSASGANLLDITESAFDGAAQLTEQDIETYSFHRIRLSYDNLDDTAADFGLKDTSWLDLTDASGNPVSFTTDINSDKEAAYKDIAGCTTDKMIFVPSTGELLISDSLYEKIKQQDTNITVNYNKSNWTKGDLVPEHYFVCSKTDNSTTPPTVINYNDEIDSTTGAYEVFLKGGIQDQEIEYQVGFGQYIRVNTDAGSIFQHDIGRDVDEIIELANQLTDNEKIKDRLDEMMKNSANYSETQLADIKRDKEAADKAVTLLKDQLQKKFSGYITNTQSYLDTVTQALTTVGSRSARLELISNRLDDQTTTFKTLQSDNEDADATEVAVQLSSAKISYSAALMATSEMIQETLLNYL